MTSKIRIRPQVAADVPVIDALHAQVFGPGRFARSAYRIREAATTAPVVALTAWHGTVLAGAIQLTAISIGGRRGAVLLGPLVVAPGYQNRGHGARLISEAIQEAGRHGYELVLLVGDISYYAKAGFRPIPAGQITLPGPADPARLLANELQPGSLTAFRGMAAADNEPALVMEVTNLSRTG